MSDKTINVIWPHVEKVRVDNNGYVEMRIAGVRGTEENPGQNITINIHGVCGISRVVRDVIRGKRERVRRVQRELDAEIGWINAALEQDDEDDT